MVLNTVCVKRCFVALATVTLALVVTVPCTANRLLSVSASNGLRYTDRDAKIIAAAFGRYVGFSRNNIHILSGKKATRNAIVDEIGQWLIHTQKPDDLVVLFLAGHGMIIGTEYYFVPHLHGGLDSVDHILENGLEAERLIPGSLLKHLLNNATTPNVLLVVDTCHSGAVAGLHSKSTSGNAFFTPDTRGIMRGITVLPGGQIAQGRNESLNFTLIAASKPMQMAEESKRLKNGVLTHYLVRVLKAETDVASIFDSRRICDRIIHETKREGWTQDVVMAGGQYFRAHVKDEKMRAIPIY